MMPDSLLITCPSCGFSKSVSSINFPSNPVKLCCSQCKTSFTFEEHVGTETVHVTEVASQVGENSDNDILENTDAVKCPKCGYQRGESDSIVDAAVCPKCHIVYSKWVPPPPDSEAKRTSPRPVDVQRLIYSKESTLFQLLLALTALYWLIFIWTSKGSILAFVVIFALAHLIGQSALIAHLKGNGIRISTDQFPELYERHLYCCKKLGFDEAPEAYLINGSGVLNAFATRFLGRDFVVLYSNVVQAMADDPEAINFYLGHELGHVKQKHLLWGPLLWPATLLPLVGAAYSRAREYTCDQFGRACCNTPESAVRGLVALAAGEKLWRGVSIAAYLKQAEETQGFWMSYYELISDYPWTVKRVSRVLNPAASSPERHTLSWPCAFFTPRIAAGGSAGILVTVAIIGILAAIAVPQFAQYKAKAAAAKAAPPKVQTQYGSSRDALPR
jgi:Zn-dependent protease with chaperone function